jgi:GNAT superfamily N-acetyltransferase
MRFDEGEWVAAFRAMPPGTRWWLQGLGASMWPLLSAGDGLEVERTAGSALRPGDFALLVDRRGQPVAHLVRQASPLVTAGFLRPDDARPLEPLGRVVAVRKGEAVLPVPYGAAAAFTHLHGQLVRPAVQARLRALLEVASGPATLPLRTSWTGPLAVRRLAGGDAHALVTFLGRHPVLDVPWAVRQLRRRWQAEGMAVGAWDARGRLRAFTFADSYRQEGVAADGTWVRALFVDRWSRGRGIGESLVQALCGEHDLRGTPELLADVRRDNAPSLRLFARLGFREDPAATRALEAVSSPRPVPVVALSRARAVLRQSPSSDR